MGMECEDCRRREIEELFRVILPVKGSEWWTAAELLEDLGLITDWVPFKIDPEAGDAAKSLGRYLAKHRKQQIGMYVLDVKPDTSRGHRYRLQPAEEARRNS